MLKLSIDSSGSTVETLEKIPSANGITQVENFWRVMHCFLYPRCHQKSAENCTGDTVLVTQKHVTNKKETGKVFGVSWRNGEVYDDVRGTIRRIVRPIDRVGFNIEQIRSTGKAVEPKILDHVDKTKTCHMASRKPRSHNFPACNRIDPISPAVLRLAATNESSCMHAPWFF
jgi:hypothetical protein